MSWVFVEACWKADEREYQYVTLDYLEAVKGRLTENDIPKLMDLALRRSWWDSVDCLDGIIGDIAYRFPAVNETLLAWASDDSIWLRRIAIDHQLSRKGNTDTDLLGQIILANLGSDEFFVNKAIGWALREYSKSNPEWVREFVAENRTRMSALSVREGSNTCHIIRDVINGPIWTIQTRTLEAFP